MLNLHGFLTPDQEKDFFEKLKVGDLFEYSMNHYTFKDVEDVALDKGTNIKYCKPGTEEHITFGCFICKVVENINGKVVELPKFNPEELDI